MNFVNEGMTKEYIATGFKNTKKKDEIIIFYAKGKSFKKTVTQQEKENLLRNIEENYLKTIHNYESRISIRMLSIKDIIIGSSLGGISFIVARNLKDIIKKMPIVPTVVTISALSITAITSVLIIANYITDGKISKATSPAAKYIKYIDNKTLLQEFKLDAKEEDNILSGLSKRKRLAIKNTAVNNTIDVNIVNQLLKNKDIKKLVKRATLLNINNTRTKNFKN